MTEEPATIKFSRTKRQEVKAYMIRFDKLWKLERAILSTRKRGGVLCVYREVVL